MDHLLLDSLCDRVKGTRNRRRDSPLSLAIRTSDCNWKELFSKGTPRGDFVAIHRTLRVAIAMGVGVTSHLWSVADVAAMVEVYLKDYQRVSDAAEAIHRGPTVDSLAKLQRPNRAVRAVAGVELLANPAMPAAISSATLAASATFSISLWPGYYGLDWICLRLRTFSAS